MNKFAFSAALTVLAVAIPAVAPAQRLSPTVVAMVDTQRILAECTACRAANTQLQQQVTQLQQRQQQLAQPLQTEGQQIQTAISALNGKQADAALQQRIKAFDAKQNTANQELARTQQNIQSIQAHVQQQIGTKLGPIVTQVMNNRGATIVIERGATLAAAPSIDVTNDVLTALNQQLPSVSVTPLPQQQQQPNQGR